MIIVDVKQSHTDLTEDSDDVGLVMREKRLVDKFIIKSGMLRFSFLLECCHPGTVPDPQLIAAMIQLVREKLSLLLTCTQKTYKITKKIC